MVVPFCGSTIEPMGSDSAWGLGFKVQGES